MMRYLSVCSGIEAATVAWHPLGWSPVGFAEVERFPSEVLAHHYGSNLPGEPLSRNPPPNFGDITKFREWPDATVDVLVGGTPCQSFSVAGLRGGLADPRGNLALVYLAIAERYRPQWLVWENVPGVLSSGEGRDFGSFLGGLGELGYGFAYRVLDAQFCRVDGFGRAVPQRRRRVFVVGHLGDWRRAAAVLFDAASLRGDPAPRREAGAGIAVGTLAGTSPGGGWRVGADEAAAGQLVAFGGNNTSGPLDVATAVNAHGGPCGRMDFESETFVCAPSLTSNPYGDHESREGLLVAHALRAEGFDASEDGTGRGTPIVPIAFNSREDPAVTRDISGALGSSHPQAQAIAFDLRGRVGGSQFEGPHETANIRAASGGSSRSYLATQWAVRRLTPLECERLQGFPDGYTAIPRKNGPAADDPRYKALGNSMAVNCMRWIGLRIEAAERIATRAA
jgi:DNA (cytosine-5)-methyltransferase 1